MARRGHENERVSFRVTVSLDKPDLAACLATQLQITYSDVMSGLPLESFIDGFLAIGGNIDLEFAGQHWLLKVS